MNFGSSIGRMAASNKQTVKKIPEMASVLENEIELVEGCRAGKDTAREELYVRYSKSMLAVCYRYTGDLEAAYDVLHDGFIKVFTHFTFRGECRLKTWLTKIMVSQAIDYLRQRRRLNHLFVGEDQLPELVDEPAVEDAVAAELSQEILMRFVAELPIGCRTVFNLYVFEEKTHKEIARMLRIKEHSSTSQLHRAKSLLAKRIKEYVAREKGK